MKPFPLAYGPIVSRRLGKSLGVNTLGPIKICSFDCRYCDRGPTEMTMNKVRKDFVFPSVADIVEAVREGMRGDHEMPDAITFSGNGEPTLHPEFDVLVAEIKKARDEMAPNAKLVAITNGAHLDSKKVITALNMLDTRIVKLDAGNDKMMKLLNAPLVRRNLAQLLTGMKKLNNVVLDAMFVKGSVDNTGNADVDEWIEIVGMIKPAGVQLFTISRPPMDPKILAVDEDTLYSIAFKLKKRTQLEAQVFGAK
jgi:wyosine [tRNA(Phe)-imidazoG37] synthetase (radical SAM superfamily)